VDARVSPDRDEVAVMAQLVEQYRALVRELRATDPGTDARTRLWAREAALSRLLRHDPAEVQH
jgi:hypothetical protein